MSASVLERVGERLRVGDGCWEWTGAKTSAGYAEIAVRKGVLRYVHRLMYEMLVGPIPEGMELDHLCRNRGCVRPSHLEAVTHTENVRRGTAGHHMRGKTHCRHGHEFTDDNTYVTPDGRRQCRICLRDRDRAHRERTR